MKTCLKCSRSNIGGNSVYCPDCGSRDLNSVVFADTQSALPPLPGSTHVGVLATSGQRIGAFCIDLLVFFILSIVTNVPGIGLVAVAVTVVYWLLRDARGFSVGKRIVGLKVVDLSGGLSTMQQRIVRNIIFAVPSLALVIPVLGFITTYGIDAILFAVELILLISTRSRMGDRMAGTAVVKNDLWKR